MSKSWKVVDVRHLHFAVHNATGKRLYVRLQTLLLLAQGKSVSEAASLMGVSRQVGASVASALLDRAYR